MKQKITASILVLQLIFCQLYPQIQSWPPSGVIASPITSQMKLPGNRFVPSSKRYNLVWADQLYDLTDGQTEFMANNYVATQKIFSYQADEYRAYNSNFIVVAYHLSNGINPQKNEDCPSPTNNTGSGYIGVIAPDGYVSEWNDYFIPWLSNGGISAGSNTFEEMFQHFVSVDSTHRVWHIDPQWTMNLSDTNWRNYVSYVTLNWMEGNENEGCFFDVAVEEMPGLYNPAAGDPAPYNFNWELNPYGPYGQTVNDLSDFSNWMNSQYLGYFQSVYKTFHTPSIDYLILPNVDQMITGWYNETWMDGNTNGETIDGAMVENFGDATESDMYLTLSRAIEHITGRGKIMLAQFYDSTQSERYRRAGMYMLVKNENSFINISLGTVAWFPEYEIDLGIQSTLQANISSLLVPGSYNSSLFKRDYQYGMVLCNTSDSAINYNLSGKNWYIIETSGGGVVSDSGAITPGSLTMIPAGSSVSVPSSGCLILKNSTLTNMVSLTVDGGSGSGNYTSGTVISIVANIPAKGMVFDKWTGATSGISNLYADSSTITMPSANATITATFKNATGLNDNYIPGFEFYPDPVYDVIYMNQSGTVSIYDLNGVLLIRKQLNGETQINVSNLKNDIYIIKFFNGKGIEVRKFIKE